MTRVMQPFQCELQAQIPKHPITTHTQAHPKQLQAAVTPRQKKTDKPTPAATVAHTRYLSSSPAATTRKSTRFRAPASSPQHTACNIHAAIPMRSATTASRNAWNYAHRNSHCCKTHRRNQTTPAAPAAHTRYLSSPAAATLHGKTQGFVLRLPPHNTRHATFMQPFQCDLQPQLQETHGTTHTGTTIVAKHIEGTKRPQPHPPHTRGTFHRRLQPLYTEKHKVSCSGFLPTTHSMQHSCSHSNAICNHSFKKRMELRTQEQPLLQNT